MYKLLSFLFVLSCTTPPPDLRQQAEREIRAADIAMSTQAVQDGFNHALLAWSDNDVVKYQEGSLPIIGKAALSTLWEGKPDTKAISWKPFKVEAAHSGELGYSLGYWQYVTEDTTLHGNYYTIWKKQADGSWKFVLDGGNGTPAPPN